MASDRGVDIVVFGTGSFAARILCDLAATAERGLTVAIAGRNAERLAWLKTATNARAVLFQRPGAFVTRTIDLGDAAALAALLAADRPKVVVQAASAQPAAVIATKGDAWSQLVAEGGLSATAVFQALFSMRVARAMREAGLDGAFVNGCFPDVVNPLIAASGLKVACGIGNIGILSNAFAGALGLSEPGAVKLLATYQTLVAWRRPKAARSGPVPRVWVRGSEIADVLGTFAEIRLTVEPALEISGASGVPLIAAMAAATPWVGHVPGPLGLPGGYPVAWRGGTLALDLPPGIDRAAAVAWNEAFEAKNGLVVSADGKARYTGHLEALLRRESPDLAGGFEVAELEAAHREMAALRARLQARPARSA